MPAALITYSYILVYLQYCAPTDLAFQGHNVQSFLFKQTLWCQR